MNNTIVYNQSGILYLNITNKCPCNCAFCIRNNGDGINENESLWLTHEPTLTEIKEAINNYILIEYKEIVFCGYGEPTERLNIIIEVAKFIKEKSDIKIRINTNGLSDLINNKKTAKLLSTNIDEISISLNAPKKEEYYKLCKPTFGEDSFDAIINFAKDCKKYIDQVYFTVVDIIGNDKIKECQELCNDLGIQLRVRQKI